MLGSTEFSFFIISSIVLIIAPGPDVIFLIAQSLQNSLKVGLAIALGLASGNLVHTLAAALGVTLVLQTNDYALTIIQYLGAAYLLYLAYLAITAKATNQENSNTPSKLPTSFFIRGLLMNILNPKVGLFFLAFLPQFIPETSKQPHTVMIILGLVFTTLVIIIFSSVAILTHHFRQHTFLNSINQRYLNWLSATVFIALSLHLLVKKF